MKGILALLFLCATSQFAHGHHFSVIHTHHGLLGPKLLVVTSSILSVIGSAYSEDTESEPEQEPEPADDSSEDVDEEVMEQSRAFFGLGHRVKKGVCKALCKKVLDENRKLNKTEFLTPNSISFRFFKTVPKQEGLKFKVKAANDAYIVLTSGLGAKDPRYEVRLGILANHQTTIAKDRYGASVATVITPRILSKDEFREFWIKWDEGTIRVLRENENRAFVAYADPNLFEVNYLGFGTRWGAQGTWIAEGIGNEA